MSNTNTPSNPLKDSAPKGSIDKAPVHEQVIDAIKDTGNSVANVAETIFGGPTPAARAEIAAEAKKLLNKAIEKAEDVVTAALGTLTTAKDAVLAAKDELATATTGIAKASATTKLTKAEADVLKAEAALASTRAELITVDPQNQTGITADDAKGAAGKNETCKLSKRQRLNQYSAYVDITPHEIDIASAQYTLTVAKPNKRPVAIFVDSRPVIPVLFLPDITASNLLNTKFKTIYGTDEGTAVWGIGEGTKPLSNVVKNVSKTLGGVVGNIGSCSSIIRDVSATFSENIGSPQDFLNNLGEKMKSFPSHFADASSGILADASSGILADASSGILAGASSGILENAGDKLLETGKSYGENVVDELTSSVIDPAKVFADKLDGEKVNALKDIAIEEAKQNANIDELNKKLGVLSSLKHGIAGAVDDSIGGFDRFTDSVVGSLAEGLSGIGSSLENVVGLITRQAIPMINSGLGKSLTNTLRAFTSELNGLDHLIDNTVGDLLNPLINGISSGVGKVSKLIEYNPFHSGETRQTKLDQFATEVYDEELPANLRHMQTFGWGTVYATHRPFLLDLHKRLNEIAEDGDFMSDWEAHVNQVLGDIPFDQLGKTSEANITTKKLEEAQLKKASKFKFDIWSQGYNWLKSNEDASIAISEFIDKTIMPYYENRGINNLVTDNKILLITHGMGGLVARYLNIEHKDKILCTSHTAMPSNGMPEIYRNARTGIPGFFSSWMMGGTAEKYCSVMMQCQGALELLPTGTGGYLSSHTNVRSGTPVFSEKRNPSHVEESQFRNKNVWLWQYFPKQGENVSTPCLKPLGNTDKIVSAKTTTVVEEAPLKNANATISLVPNPFEKAIKEAELAATDSNVYENVYKSGAWYALLPDQNLKYFDPAGLVRKAVAKEEETEKDTIEEPVMNEDIQAEGNLTDLRGRNNTESSKTTAPAPATPIAPTKPIAEKTNPPQELTKEEIIEAEKQVLRTIFNKSIDQVKKVHLAIKESKMEHEHGIWLAAKSHECVGELAWVTTPDWGREEPWQAGDNVKVDSDDGEGEMEIGKWNLQLEDINHIGDASVPAASWNKLKDAEEQNYTILDKKLKEHDKIFDMDAAKRATWLFIINKTLELVKDPDEEAEENAEAGTESAPEAK